MNNYEDELVPDDRPITRRGEEGGECTFRRMADGRSVVAEGKLNGRNFRAVVRLPKSLQIEMDRRDHYG